MNNRETLRVLLDWCQFTVKTLTLGQVFDLLRIPESDFTDLPYGLYGYKSQKICGDIRIMFDGNADMGIHVQLSGQGCREFETYYDGQWIHLMEAIRRCSGNYARIDLACDEFRWNGDKPYFTVRTLVRKVKRKECRSRWKSLNHLEQLKIADGSSLGDTVYFGSRESDIQFRIYEKDRERQNADMELEAELTTWNRAELQLRDDRADKVAQMIIDGLPAGELMMGIVRNYLNFTTRITGDSNKGRWPVAEWWELYLGEAEKIRLAEAAPDKTIEAKKEWIQRQAHPTIAEIWYASGSPGHDHLWEMIHDGLERMTERQWARADAYIAEQEKETERMTRIKTKQRQRYEERQEIETADRIARRTEEFERRNQLQAYETQKREALERFPSKDPQE